MQLLLNGRAHSISQADLLGVGGEADVYAKGDLAIKIYRGLDTASLEARARKLAAFPKVSTSRVLAPLFPVQDVQNRTVGYAMRKLDGAREFGSLCRSKSHFSMSDTVSALSSLYEVVAGLHREGLVVGDLNDGNVLMKKREALLIDCDSMQFGQFNCPVAHERTLAPELYGVDLERVSAFTEGTDWYAFGVLAVSSLLGVHPYGGTHPTLRTLLRRAEASVSILSDTVTYPRAARPLDTLPDEWIAWIRRTFEQNERNAFPAKLLRTAFTQCICGDEHARAQCPNCATVGKKPAATTAGRCVATAIVRTSGALASVDRHTASRYAALIGETLTREQGDVVCTIPDGYTRSIVVGARTYVTTHDHFWCYRVGALDCEGSVASFLGDAAFDANEDGAFGVRDGLLHELHSGRRLGQLVDGLSWVRVGQTLGFALCMTGALTHAFVFRTKGGIISKSEFPKLEGKVVSLEGTFDDEHIVISLALDANGRRKELLVMLAADGSLIAHSTVAGVALEADAGRCVALGAVLTATDDGLTLVRPRAGRFEVERRFSETRAWVSRDAHLTMGPDGSVLVMRGNTLVQLSMK